MNNKIHRSANYIIGIDEVGRGALAGPVVVAAAMIPAHLRFTGPKNAGPLKDSKKLSPQKRAIWVAYFKNHPNITFTLARVYPNGIERLNISQAANLAAQRAYERLIATATLPMVKNHKIYLDGGLFLGKRAAQPNNAKTIIKADEKITAVKIASIIAKVHRDKFITQLAKQYPSYGFEIHKGYGTKIHLAALKKYGMCDAHRKTFCGHLT